MKQLVFNKLFLTVFICLQCLSCYPQSGELEKFTGTFISSNQATSLQAKINGQNLEGVLYEQQVILPFKGQAEGDILNGYIYTQEGKIPFTASLETSAMKLKVDQNELILYKTSQTHLLGNVDLSPYFNDNTEIQPETYQAEKSPTEKRGNSNYPALHNLIAGGQLVVFMRSSYISDNTASSMTYYNFCPNGTFNLSSDASFSVEGNYGGNAHGASRSDQHGRWEIVQYKGEPAVKMNYADGDVGYNYINEQRLRSGRWKIGNRQYSFLKGKANCR